MFCWQCGKEIYPGAFFCTNCGLKIRQPEASVQGEVGTAQNTPESAVREQAGAVQMMQPVSTVQLHEMTERTHEPETMMSEPAVQMPEVPTQAPTVTPQADNILANEPSAVQMPFPAPVMPSETAMPLNADVPPQPIVTDGGTNSSIGQPVSVSKIQPEAPRVQAAPQIQPEAPQVQAAPQMQAQVPQMQTIFQGQVTVPGAQGEPRRPKKGVIIAVMVAAILVFLVGVWGAFYFAEDSYEDYSLTLGKWEDSEESEESEQSKNHSEEDFEEGMTESQEEDSGEGMKDSLKEEDPEETKENPWKTPKNGEEDFSGVPEIKPFSGRDIYPDIDGYAEGSVGDIMHTYWFDYTVTYAYVCSEYGGYIPSDGIELLVVEMTVKNTFDESIPMFDVDFQAQWEDLSDEAYAWPLMGAEYLGGNVLPESYTLEEDQMVTGLLLFEVPAGYNEFSLSYWELFDDDSTGDVFFLYFTADRIQSNNSL